ncbi:MAG: hypothetical protein LBL62_04955, partial [Planctomycetaceae bacterium]|nr:hypothetical protein [Planctomycetaceae bacterium]
MKRIFILLTVFSLATPLFAVTLKPENTEQFFITPDTESVLRFRIISDEKPEAAEFRLSGAETKTIPAVIAADKTITATVNLPRGF